MQPPKADYRASEKEIKMEKFEDKARKKMRSVCLDLTGKEEWPDKKVVRAWLGRYLVANEEGIGAFLVEKKYETGNTVSQVYLVCKKGNGVAVKATPLEGRISTNIYPYSSYDPIFLKRIWKDGKKIGIEYSWFMFDAFEVGYRNDSHSYTMS